MELIAIAGALLLYGLCLLGFCGVVYAATATIRRAWHPERQPPSREAEPICCLRWMLIFLGVCAVAAVHAWLTH
jgi:hypothetical protein